MTVGSLTTWSRGLVCGRILCRPNIKPLIVERRKIPTQARSLDYWLLNGHRATITNDNIMSECSVKHNKLPCWTFEGKNHFHHLYPSNISHHCPPHTHRPWHSVGGSIWVIENLECLYTLQYQFRLRHTSYLLNGFFKQGSLMFPEYHHTNYEIRQN